MGIVRVILIFLICSGISFAQEGDESSIKDKADDAFMEMSTGKLTLRFINAMNGEYINNGVVRVGDKKFKTDSEGAVHFKPPKKNGKVPVKFKKDGFITTSTKIVLRVGTIFQNRISVSPELEPESIRIVLDWSDDPNDLDAHFVKQGDYHISYRDMKTSEDGMARLDRDDRDGNGPETITANRIESDNPYVYRVHDYSNRNDDDSEELSEESGATVRVFDENRLLNEYRIDGGKEGSTWTVFRIEDGRIYQVDEVN